jgi:hypothetical protein
MLIVTVYQPLLSSPPAGGRETEKIVLKIIIYFFVPDFINANQLHWDFVLHIFIQLLLKGMGHLLKFTTIQLVQI